MGYYIRTLKDYDGENTSMRVNAEDLNAGNIAAQLVLQANFGTAINGMTTGSLQKIAYGNQTNSLQPAPSDTWSQRELKWKVNYRDDVTGDPFEMTIGTADTALLDPNNRDRAFIGDAGPVDQFVADFEAYVLSPDGNPVTILMIPLVGRNI